jgi:hypothetical protein
MAGFFKVIGALNQTLVTTAELVTTTANAGLALAQGAEASAIKFRDNAILETMEELGLASGNPEEDLKLWKALRDAERIQEEVKTSRRVVTAIPAPTPAPTTAP